VKGSIAKVFHFVVRTLNLTLKLALQQTALILRLFVKEDHPLVQTFVILALVWRNPGCFSVVMASNSEMSFSSWAIPAE
jgi:hypothetical protein